MATPTPDSKTPAMIAFAFVVVGVVIAAITGITKGSILGGVIAAVGAIPACLGMWKGIQQETQTTLAMSVGAVLLSLGVAAILIVLRIVHWVA